MATFTEGDHIDPLLDETIRELYQLARGDFDLVEEAVMACLEQSRGGVWKPREWRVNIMAAANYIIKRRNELENISTADDIEEKPSK
jgi:hypothetical protein